MTEPYLSASQRATAILNDRYPGEEIKKLYESNRGQDKIEMLRDAVFTLLNNEIPTCTIAEVLKKTIGTVQYHARHLEKAGKLARSKKGSHWVGSIPNEN
jgi:DNA-binding transcriptional ArsR family regulator